MICIHILDVIIWSLPPWILSNLFGRRITLFELETVWINKSSQYILSSEVSIYFCLKNHLEWFLKVKSYGRLTHPAGHAWKWKIVSYQSIRKIVFSFKFQSRCVDEYLFFRYNTLLSCVGVETGTIIAGKWVCVFAD